MADQLDGYGAVETGLRGQIDLAHAPDCELALETEIAAQDHAFILGRRPINGHRGFLSDLERIDARIRSDRLGLEEIASS